MRKLVLLIGFCIFTLLSFSEEVVNNNNINVNLNLNDIKSELQLQELNKASIGFGFTTPFIGTAKDVVQLDGVNYTKSVSGMNIMIGFTKRNYLGKGLPENGGAVYLEYGTVVLLVPFIGVGYDYKIGENFTIGVGFPDAFHFSIMF